MKLIGFALAAALLVPTGASAQAVAAPRSMPPEEGTFDLSSIEVAPRLRNRAEVQRVVESAFLDALRPERGRGSVNIRFRVDVDGKPAGEIVPDSTADPRVARAAIRVVQAMRFSPALINDKPVAVFITVPLRYDIPATPAPAPADSAAPTAPAAPVTSGASGVYDIAAVEVKPQLINQSATADLLARNYPPGLRDAGIGGTVILAFVIDPDGRTRNIEVRKTDDPGLSAAAYTVVRAMRFRPGTLDGRPVAVSVTLPVTFAAH